MTSDQYQEFKERHNLCDREMELLDVEVSPWLKEIQENQNDATGTDPEADQSAAG